MTSMMFNHGGDGAGDSRDLLDRGIERFRSDSVVSGDSCDSNNGDDNSGREGGGKKKKQPKSPLRAKSESVTLSGGAKKLPHFYHEVNGKHFTNNIMESIQEVLGELDESNKVRLDKERSDSKSNIPYIRTTNHIMLVALLAYRRPSTTSLPSIFTPTKPSSRTRPPRPSSPS